MNKISTIKRDLFLTAVFLCLLSFKKAGAQNEVSPVVYSLQQCIDTALKYNKDIYYSRIQMQADEADVMVAKGNRLPYVTGDINHGISQGRGIDPFTNSYINQNLTFANYGLNASLPLWRAGAINNNIKANRLNYEADKMDWQQQKENITINIILAYLEVLRNDEQLTAALQQADVTRSQVKRLDIMNQSGAIAPATFYDTKGQLGSDELNVISLKNALETSKVTLMQLMNIPYQPGFTAKKIEAGENIVFYDAGPLDIYQQAEENLALVKSATLRKQSAGYALKSAKGQLFPSISLNGGLGTNYSNAATIAIPDGSSQVETGQYVWFNNDKLPVYATQNNFTEKRIPYGTQWKNNFNSNVSVGLRIPILTGNQTRALIKKAEIEQRKTEFDEMTTKTQLQHQIEQAFVNMKTAFETYQTLVQQVKDYGESFRSAEVRFNAGVITSVDYLIAKNNYDRSRINLISAKYDYVLRTRILDYYRGRL